MAVTAVHASDDAAEALRVAGGFLLADPVRNNVFLTILSERAEHPDAGRYWWAQATPGGAVVGFAMQSPRGFSAGVAPASGETVDALCDRMMTEVPALPGVIADAAVAARFAGRWAQCLSVPARPTEGQRLYRLARFVPPGDRPPGRLRPAGSGDRDTLVRWARGFLADVGGLPEDPVSVVARHLVGNRLWVWDDDGPAAMASATAALAGVRRIGFVYTPPERRRRRYATGCVAAVSEHLLTAGAECCILFTQLHNPISNAIYRRMGYEPVAENLVYRFGLG